VTAALVTVYVVVATLILIDLVRGYRRSVADDDAAAALAAAIEAERTVDRRVLRALTDGRS